VGGGIVGAACAFELAQAGLRVVVVEPNAIGSGATNLGYGSLSHLDQSPAQSALIRYGLSLWEKLVEWLPPDCEYRRCGTVWLAFNQQQEKELSVRAQLLKQQGVRSELLDSRQLSEAEPGLTAGSATGLLVPDDSWLRASRAAEFLFQLAAKKGAQHLRQQAAGIDHHEVTFKDGSSLFAGNIINAAGNQSLSLTPGLPLTYLKSHVLVVETQAVCARHQLSAHSAERLAGIEGQVRFVAYQKDAAANRASQAASEVWIGSSSQPVSQSASLQVEPKLVAHLLRRAIEIIPAIGRARPLRSWTGLRARTADGLPIIGPVPGSGGVLAATAHNAYGASTSLATARLIAAELLSQTPDIDPAPYRSDRFKKDQSFYAK
jgi:glycine/D-amino acid oxidase-like deaminating enzyme